MTTLTLHVGRGDTRGALTVFPIWEHRHPGTEVRLADETSVRVTEVVPEPHVPALQVTDVGSTPVLLLDGDLLVGGMQDRVAVGSVLLLPGRPAVVDVRCVEQDRWSGSINHSSGGQRATAFVRADHEQHEVWRRVAAERQRRGSPPDVADLHQLPGQSGVLIGIGGHPVLLELFANSRLLTAAWSRILETAARESVGRPTKATTGHRARAFIARVDHLAFAPGPGGGAGRTIAGAVGPLELRGISHTDRLLYASIIDRDAVAV
jgi:hypothetical protein